MSILTGTADAEQAGSKARVTARRRPAELPSLVILGNGMASYKMCERLVESGAVGRYRVTVLGEEKRPAYDRVHLTDFLTGKQPDDLLLARQEWYAEHGIELHLGDAAISIDRVKRCVCTAGGKEVVYDKLIFATGSRAFMPSMPGNDLPGVYVYRTIEDLEAIKALASKGGRAAVLGGGLLGLEAAWALQKLGMKTWVVERGSGLLARQLDPQASSVLLKQVERLGMNVCLGRETQGIEAHGDDLLVQMGSGEALRVQMVVVAVGIRPRDELAAACGLKLGARGGILVNDQLETSDPAIYAIGECAVHNGTIYGLAAPAYRMAEALASSLGGKRKKFTGADLSTRLKLPGIEVTALGDYQADLPSIVREDKEGYRRLVMDGSKLVGAVGIGPWPELARLQELVDRRGRLWRWRRQRFERTGRIWSEEAARNVAMWPAEALVCNCVGIRRGALSAACASGCKTVEQLADKTKASTVCGSCKPLLAELVGQQASFAPVRGNGLLITVALLALLLVSAIILLKPIAFSSTVQVQTLADRLWADTFTRQVTGFVVLGISLLSLVFSLRKRIKRFTFGGFGWWRAVHATIGVLTLLALVTHTGFRMGQNLNRVLMLNFLALALLGALAGAVTALENRLDGPAARRLRALWTWSHILLVWPLPVLLVFHVLASYYF